MPIPFVKYCYKCQKQVARLDHDRHEKILDCLIRADAPGSDSLFVHCQGDEELNFDMDYGVVVCDHCFVAELADNLLPMPLSD